MVTEIETVTPEKAAEYLTHNKGNRPVKTGEVEQLARAIKDGRFRLTHQGIAFDENGVLIDGQQRLNAVVMAGRPIRIYVTRGVPVGSVQAVDRGIVRSPRDVMVISGVGTTDYEKKMICNTVLLSTVHQFVACGYRKRRVDPDEDVILIEKLMPQLRAVYESCILRAKGTRPCQMFAAALAALCCGESPSDVSRFFDVFFHDDIAGCEENNVRVVLNWKRQLSDGKIRRVRIDPQKLYLGTQNAIWHFVRNTDVTRVTIPGAPRYDVQDLIIETIGE